MWLSACLVQRLSLLLCVCLYIQFVYNMPLGIFVSQSTMWHMCFNWWQFLCCPPWNVWSGSGPRSPSWPFSPNPLGRRWVPCCEACLDCRWGHRWESFLRFPHCQRWVACLRSGWRRFHLSSLPGRWRKLHHTGSRNWMGHHCLPLMLGPCGRSQEIWLG